MKDTFPDFQRGEALPAKHINKLNRVARRLDSPIPTPYGHSHNGVNLPGQPFVARNLIVTDEDDFNGDTALITVRFRYWDGSAWVTDNDAGDKPLDATVLGHIFFNDDLLSGWFDVQRDAFIPLDFPNLLGSFDSDVASLGTGTFTLFQPGTHTPSTKSLSSVINITQNTIDADAPAVADRIQGGLWGASGPL